MHSSQTPDRTTYAIRPAPSGPRATRRVANGRRAATLLTAALAAGSLVGITGEASADGPPIDGWERTWTPADGGWALADLVVVDATGASYISTRPQAGGGNGTGLARYDADGTLLWSIETEEVPDSSEGFTDLEVTATGIAGVAVGSSDGSPRTLVVNRDATGAIEWTASVIGPAIPGFLQPQLAIAPDGARVVATDDGSGNGVLIRYSASGDVLAETPLSFSGFGGVSALAVDADGNAIIAVLEEFSRVRIERYDPAGSLTWFHEEAADGLVLSETQLVVGPGGAVIAAAAFEMFEKVPFRVETRLWKLEADGSLAWSTPSVIDFSVPIELAVAEDGSLYLTRNTSAGTSELQRFAADGTPDWTRTFAGDDFDTNFTDVAVDGSGTIVVGATDSSGSQPLAMRVLRYDQTGDLLWSGRVTEPVADVRTLGSDMALGPDGRVTRVGTRRPDVGLDEAFVVHRRFAPCLGDLDASGGVAFEDLIALLAAWGDAPGLLAPADFDQDGVVGFSDLVALLGVWGPCPNTG